MSKNFENADCYDIYKELFTKKQRETMEMYYFSDLSLGEISEETGASRQAAFACIKRCEEKLDEFEKALGLMEKRSRLEKILKELDEMTGCREAARVAEELRELL